MLFPTVVGYPAGPSSKSISVDRPIAAWDSTCARPFISVHHRSVFGALIFP